MLEVVLVGCDGSAEWISQNSVKPPPEKRLKSEISCSPVRAETQLSKISPGDLLLYRDHGTEFVAIVSEVNWARQTGERSFIRIEFMSLGQAWSEVWHFSTARSAFLSGRMEILNRASECEDT